MQSTQVMREMPRYQCHKKVWALKIKDVDTSSGKVVIMPADDDYAPFEVSEDWALKHSPQPGGYYVVYEGGYKSYSPAEAFEDGYTRI